MSAEPTSGVATAPIALMMCPLCFGESGRRVAIVAEYAVRPARAATVAHLVGCEHGARFGQADALTLAERRRLIGAALAMWEAGRRDPTGQSALRASTAPHELPLPILLSCRDRGAGCRAEGARRSLRRGHRTPR